MSRTARSPTMRRASGDAACRLPGRFIGHHGRHSAILRRASGDGACRLPGRFIGHHGRHSAILRRVASAAALVAALVASSIASASGLTPPTTGHAWSGPATVDAAATFWNPAMLAGVRQARIEGNLDLIFPSIYYTRERRGVYQREDSFKFAYPLAEADLDRSKTATAPSTFSTTTLLPAGSLFAAIPMHDRVTIGLGFYGLAGAVISFPDQSAARYQLQEALILGLTLTGGAGVRITDSFFAGATASYVHGRLGLRKVADLAGTDLLGAALASPQINQPNDFGQSAPTGVRELAVLSRPFTLNNGIAHAATFSLGLAALPSKSLTLGLSYVHRVPLKFKGRFVLDMNDDFFTKDLAAQGLLYPPLVKGDAYVEFPLPASVKFGASLQVRRALRLQLNTEYFHYSSIETFLVTLQSASLAQPSLGIGDTVVLVEPRRWRNTVTVEGTAVLRMSEEIEMGATLGYQSAASPDATVDLASPDGNRIVAAIAGRLTLGRIELSGGAKIHHILTRTVTSSDFDKGNGTYKVTIFMLSGTLAVAF